MPDRKAETDVLKSQMSAAMQDAELARRSTAWTLGILALGEVAGLDRFLASHYHWPAWVEIAVDLAVLVSTAFAIRRMLKQPLRMGSRKGNGMPKPAVDRIEGGGQEG